MIESRGCTLLCAEFFSCIIIQYLSQLFQGVPGCRKTRVCCYLEDRFKYFIFPLKLLNAGHHLDQKPPDFWDQSESPCWVESFNALDIASFTHIFKLFPFFRASIVIFLCNSGSTRTTNFPEYGFSGSSPRSAQKVR